MNTIEIHEAGLLTTVQDLGRDGFGPLGVSPAGAADQLSLRIGNRLVGNRDDAPAIELTLVGGAIGFPQGAVIALSGSDFGATLDGEPISLWQSHHVPPGGVLRLPATRSGCRSYLCVHGGIDVPGVLGSASTHLLSALGGFRGRALRRGDMLAISAPTSAYRKHHADQTALRALAPRKTLRVTSGQQTGWFPAATLRTFFESSYLVSEASNRMGLRLEGPSVAPDPPREMLTEGVSLGAIQIPPNGQPIILFVDQQTTGGYPKIANVIAADLHSVGQLRPRDEVRFELIDFAAARMLLVDQENLIQSAIVETSE